jgi:hypothetical protein
MARTNLPQPPNHDPNGPHQNTSLCALHARSAHHLSLESKIQTAGAIVENGSKMDQNGFALAAVIKSDAMPHPSVWG